MKKKLCKRKAITFEHENGKLDTMGWYNLSEIPLLIRQFQFKVRIGKGVKIGDNVTIKRNVIIQDFATLTDNAVVEQGSTIKSFETV